MKFLSIITTITSFITTAAGVVKGFLGLTKKAADSVSEVADAMNPAKEHYSHFDGKTYREDRNYSSGYVGDVNTLRVLSFLSIQQSELRLMSKNLYYHLASFELHFHELSTISSMASKSQVLLDFVKSMAKSQNLDIKKLNKISFSEDEDRALELLGNLSEVIKDIKKDITLCLKRYKEIDNFIVARDEYYKEEPSHIKNLTDYKYLSNATSQNRHFLTDLEKTADNISHELVKLNGKIEGAKELMKNMEEDDD